MLYDPKWEAKVDPLSVAGLIAWLERQNPTTEYNYHDCRGRCLISQYLRAQGLNPCDDYARFAPRARFGIAAGGQRTFGAALERARTAISSAQGQT